MTCEKRREIYEVMEMEIKVDSRVFNKVYIPYLFNYKTSNHRYLVLLGGAGSGKSHFIAQRTILRLLQEPNHRILVVRKVASSLRNSVYKLFKDIVTDWKLNPYFHFQDSYLKFSTSSGSEVIFTGVDDVEKLKSITGLTSMWLEEATELTQTDFQQLDLRLRGNKGYLKEVILTFNPVSETHWIKKRFYDTICADAIKLKTLYTDNSFIDSKYVEVLENLKDTDPVYYSIYCLGEWGSTGNMVWSNYRIENFAQEDKNFDHIYCGLDFGYNDPSALVKIGVKDGEIYILQEFYQSKLTNTELIQKLQMFKQYRITADSAEPARIKEFYQAGFKIQACTKGKDSVKRGIDFIRGKKLHIHHSCKNFISEIQGYTYLQDKAGNPTEEVIGVNDHLMAAIRYGIEPLSKQDKVMFLR